MFHSGSPKLVHEKSNKALLQTVIEVHLKTAVEIDLRLVDAAVVENKTGICKSQTGLLGL